jgi:hypothetical protein
MAAGSRMIAEDKRINQLVAITVLLLSIFTGLCNIKDGNINQNMQLAKADSVDRWGEYQATKTKLHIDETALRTLSVVATTATPAGKQLADDATAKIEVDVAKYRREIPQLAVKAQGFADQYDALNVHDDQFDASDAMISTAISISAVAALTESMWLLTAAWIFGAFGMFMGVCGFAGLAFHPDVLSNFLG